ncbi:unnamed protein product, partial [Arabidopsis halleri]
MRYQKKDMKNASAQRNREERSNKPTQKFQEMQWTTVKGRGKPWSRKRRWTKIHQLVTSSEISPLLIL